MIRSYIVKLKNADRYLYTTVLILLDSLLAEVDVQFFVANTIGKIRRAYAIQTRESEVQTGKNSSTVLPMYETLGFHFASIGALGTRILVHWILLDGLRLGDVPRIRAGLVGSCLTAISLTVSGILFWSTLAGSRLTFPALALFSEMGFPFHVIASIVACCVLRTNQTTAEHRRTSRSGLLSPAQSTMLVVPLVLTIVHGWYWIVDRLMYFEFTLSGKKKFLPREGRCECSDDQ